MYQPRSYSISNDPMKQKCLKDDGSTTEDDESTEDEESIKDDKMQHNNNLVTSSLSSSKLFVLESPIRHRTKSSIPSRPPPSIPSRPPPSIPSIPQASITNSRPKLPSTPAAPKPLSTTYRKNIFDGRSHGEYDSQKF